MNLLTLTSARADIGLQTVTGKCPDQEEFLRYLNSGIQRLLYRGDWFGSLFRLEVCVQDDCIVWPRQVGKIRAINLCDRSMLVQDQWASFMPFRPGDWAWQWNGPNMLWDTAYVVEQRGLSPVFKQIPCGAANWYVRLYIERQNDIGKTCTIYGVDTHGQVLRSIKDDGFYTEGLTLVAGVPYTSTTKAIRQITRVFFNEPFEGNARLYGYDADADTLHTIGLYEPGELEPAYVYSRLLRGCCRGSNASCNNVRSVVALAKINPDPVKIGTDLLQIQNLEAIKMAVQSVRKEEAGEVTVARERMNAAVAEMNLMQRDWIPDNQVPIQVYPWAGAMLDYRRIGRVN